MRRFFALFASILLVTVITVSTDHMPAVHAQTFAASALENHLDVVLSMNDGDRTAFNGADQFFTEELADHINTLYPAVDVTIQPFTFTTQVTSTNKFKPTEISLTSYNVIVFVRGRDSSHSIVIGCHYDNFKSKNVYHAATGADGVLESATSIATMLSLIEYYSAQTPAYDTVFAFFGAEAEGDFGSKYFMDSEYADMDKIMLYIQLDRIGGEYTYIYDAESPTAYGDRAMQYVSGEYFRRYSTSKLNWPIDYINDLPYVHPMLNGDQSNFYNNGIPMLVVKGGNFEGLSIVDSVVGSEYVIGSARDNIEFLRTKLPDFASRMIEVAELVVKFCDDSELEALIAKQRKQPRSWLYNSMYGYVGCFALVLLGGLVLFFVAYHYEKKYPPMKPENIKIAVFGKEYENDSEGKVIVDLHRPTKDDHIKK